MKIKSSALLHYTMEHDDTRALVEAGTISPIELEFTSLVLQILKEQEIDNILHNALQKSVNIDDYGNSLYTRAQAIEEYEQNNIPGTIPVISKNVNELMWSGNFLDSFRKMGGEFAKPDFLWEDELGSSRLQEKVSGHLIEQRSFNEKLEIQGLSYVGGKYEIDNLDKATKTSTNIENVLNYFMLGSKKNINYQNIAIPAWNDAKAILNLLDRNKGMLGQENNRKWLNSWMNRIVLGKTDDPTTHVWAGNTKVEHRKVIRGLLRMTTFFALGYRVRMGLRSFTFNSLRLIIEPLAASIADIGIKEGIDVAGVLPKAGEMVKALKYVLTDFKKARHLAYKYQLIERSERDILNSIFIKKTYKNMFSSQIAHVLNWATDAWARMLAMTAMMVKAGTWDAHVYNPKTGESTFVESKDKRFFDENGKYKSEEAKALHKALKERMVNQGILKSIDDKLERGYDYVLANNVLKWYGDKFIIGGMDDLSKGIASNQFIGAMLSQYRMFSFERLHNAGLFAHQRKVTTGTGFKVVKDEDGQYISEKELSDSDGMWQAVMSSFKYLLSRKKLSGKEWWVQNSPIRRHNIAKACIHVAFVAIIMGMIRGFADDDDDRQTAKNKGDRFNWLVNDVILLFETPGFFASPMPAVDMVLNLFNVGVGKKNVDVLMRWTGPVNAFNESSEFVSDFFDKEEEGGTF